MQISRRSALVAGALLPACLAGCSGRSPGLAVDRPRITHGVAAGDVRPDGALIWTRADRPARMVVEAGVDPGFAGARRFTAPRPLTPDADGTGRLRLVGLPAGRRVHYRVHLEDLDTGARSEPVTGVFRTAPTEAADLRLHWSGDVVGQGWGINDAIGGLPGFAAMAERDPHLFIHSGDTCHADAPLRERVTLDDGRVWRNRTTPAKAKVAESLAEFRGQYAYNLLDDNYRAFNASVAQLVQWDDHETADNWYPGEVLADDRYAEKRVDVLARRAWRAFHEWQPVDRRLAVDGRVYRRVGYGPLLDVFVLDMRSYRDDNRDAGAAAGAEGEVLGAAQAGWLVDSVRASQATWKVIAADLPIGAVLPDADDRDQEGVADGAPGSPRGREAELARVLRGLSGVPDVLWLTAGLHYTAAHRYSPEAAAIGDFAPFWEFAAGPLHAGALPRRGMDPTFGPEVVFAHAPAADRANVSPLEDFQHFGEIDVDGATRELTVRLRSTRGEALWERTLVPGET